MIMNNETGDVIKIKNREFVAITHDNLPALLFFELYPNTDIINWRKGRKFISNSFYLKPFRKHNFNYLDRKNA